MTTKVVPGMLVAAENPAEAAIEAASRMARVVRKALQERNRVRIALSGGTTPRAAYAALAKEDLDWSRVEVFFVDERAVPADSDRSNYRMVKESFVDVAKVPASNVFRMKGEASDLAAAAAEYQTLIEKHVPREGEGAPSFDLIVFGIGSDGHTASLFPNEPTLHVTDRLVAHVRAAGAREARLTLTVPVLERARNAVVLATGAEKHAPLERAWRVAGNVDETPARIIRGIRGPIVWIIDRAAGGLG